MSWQDCLDRLPKQEATAKYLAERQAEDNASAETSLYIGPQEPGKPMVNRYWFQPTPKAAWNSAYLTSLDIQEDILQAERVAWLADRGLHHPNLARAFPSFVRDWAGYLKPTDLIIGIEKRIQAIRLEWQKRKHQ